MSNQGFLHRLFKNTKLKSFLEDLIKKLDPSISIEDSEGNLVIGQLSNENLTEEYLISIDQKTIGRVKGNYLAENLTQLLTYLANQDKLIFFDDLTEIPNRRYFNDYFQQEWRLCQRENWPLSLLFCDLDYFKFYNDYYGHLQGDLCLQQVAQSLRLMLKRPTDKVFRYGGEEFAIVLPNTNSQGSQVMAKKLVEGIEKKKLSIILPQRVVT